MSQLLVWASDFHPKLAEAFPGVSFEIGFDLGLKSREGSIGVSLHGKVFLHASVDGREPIRFASSLPCQDGVSQESLETLEANFIGLVNLWVGNLNVVVIRDTCGGCGWADALLLTAHGQDAGPCPWYAHDGDPVCCARRCGWVGFIDVDSCDNSASVVWVPPEDTDEDDPGHAIPDPGREKVDD